MPLVGIGLLYTEGYFSQRIAEDGWQEAVNNPLNFAGLPLLTVKDEKGAELTIQDGILGQQKIKLAAGSAILYPAWSLHEVARLTAGRRDAAVVWIQSMVRADEQRRLLHELDV